MKAYSKAIKTILKNDYKVIDNPPPKGKDFNDYLCFQFGLPKNKTIYVSCVYPDKYPKMVEIEDSLEAIQDVDVNIE